MQPKQIFQVFEKDITPDTLSCTVIQHCDSISDTQRTQNISFFPLPYIQLGPHNFWDSFGNEI